MLIGPPPPALIAEAEDAPEKDRFDEVRETHLHLSPESEIATRCEWSSHRLTLRQSFDVKSCCFEMTDF